MKFIKIKLTLREDQQFFFFFPAELGNLPNVLYPGFHPVAKIICNSNATNKDFNICARLTIQNTF